MQITDTALALMRGHGNVVEGSSIKQATVFAAYTDVNARLQALQLDRNIVVMDEPELFAPWQFDISRTNFRQKPWSDSARAAIDRAQFGLDHTG